MKSSGKIVTLLSAALLSAGTALAQQKIPVLDGENGGEPSPRKAPKCP